MEDEFGLSGRQRSVAALLVLVGCLFFGEHLTLRQIAGMVVTMAGLAIIVGDRA